MNRGTVRALNAGVGFMLVLVGLLLFAGTLHLGWLGMVAFGAAMVAVDLVIEDQS